MKKVLIICPNYNDNAVSSFRIKSFEDYLESEGNRVQILTFGDKTELNVSKKLSTIKKGLLKNTLSTFLNRDLKDKLKKYFAYYNTIIISMPNFEFIEFIKLIPRIVNIVLDYRDQLDLTYFFRMNRYSNKLIRIAIWLDYKISIYNHKRILNKKNIKNVICVGDSACEFYKNIVLNSKNKSVINIHNGFFESDKKLVKMIRNKVNYNSEITIGLAGSIYNFRYTKELEEKLLLLDRSIVNKKIIIKHWGSCEDKLNTLVSRFSNIEFQAQGRIERDEYLKKLSNCDCFILLTSNELIWEPTTTVFDYILYSKPVLFFGNKKNEAFRVLSNCNIRIIEWNEVVDIKSEKYYRNNICIDKYCREKNLYKLNDII